MIPKKTKKQKNVLQNWMLVSRDTEDFQVKCQWTAWMEIWCMTITQAAWPTTDNSTTSLIKGQYM